MDLAHEVYSLSNVITVDDNMTSSRQYLGYCYKHGTMLFNIQSVSHKLDFSYPAPDSTTLVYSSMVIIVELFCKAQNLNQSKKQDHAYLKLNLGTTNASELITNLMAFCSLNKMMPGLLPYLCYGKTEIIYSFTILTLGRHQLSLCVSKCE